MAHEHFQNLKSKVVGDRRDQREVIRGGAGFADESEAAAWARSVIGDAGESSTDLENIKNMRKARPDLTLSTVIYIAHQMRIH